MIQTVGLICIIALLLFNLYMDKKKNDNKLIENMKNYEERQHERTSIPKRNDKI